MGASASGSEARSVPLMCCGTAEETIRLLDTNGAEQEPPTPGSANPTSVIQFSCPMYFCQEAEGFARLDVVRFGNSDSVASVEYFTSDSSAKAGIKFHHKQGRLDFKRGDTSLQLEISIINDDKWDATLEFGVTLKNCHGAALGMYLNTCRVKIIDDDAFPTNKYAKEFRSGDTEQTERIPNLSLFWEYCKMNMLNPEVKWGTIKMLILDQAKNIYFILCLYCQLYMVDVVLKPEEGGEEGEREEEEEEKREEEEGIGENATRGANYTGLNASERLRRRLLLSFVKYGASTLRRLAEEGEKEEEKEEEPSIVPEVLIIPGNRLYTAIIVGVIYILPFVLVHWIDYKKIAFDVAGHSRLHLQANLLRKFLNYKEEHRASISISDITMAMIRDVTEVVDFGYMKAINIVRITGGLICACLFILTENAKALIVCSILPVAMGLFAACRGPIVVETNEYQAETQNNAVQIANEAVTNYRLIADFYLRPYMVDKYEYRLFAYNKALVSSVQVTLNNAFFPPWLTTLLIGAYFMTGPLQLKAFGGTLTLGAFLATINIFKEVGLELAEIYMEFMEVQKCVGPLRKVSYFMNLETDLLARMKLNRMRRAQGENQRQAARGGSTNTGSNLVMTDKGEQVFAVDTIPITMTDLTFNYPHMPALLTKVNVTFEQGKLYAFLGPAHEGKATILKLIGTVLLPDVGEESSGGSKGLIFVPPHLRILHTSTDALFLTQSLLKNLIFNTDLKKVGGIDRIRRICQRLKIPESIMKFLQEDDGSVHQHSAQEHIFREWFTVLSHSDYPRINLARAFIMNPECLVLHKPAVCFDERETPNVLSLIRQHVDERGIELDEGGRSMRRRRTVFFTSTTLYGVEKADLVFEVTTERGVREITKAQAVQSIRASMGNIKANEAIS